MFERFTQQARSVVQDAVKIAEVQGAERIGAEYLLLGIVSVPGAGPAVRVLSEAGATREALERVIATGEQDARLLAKLGIDLEEVKSRVERNFGSGAWARRSARSGHIPFTADAKKALELSLRHALQQKSRSIDPTHILLGVLDSGTTVYETLHAVGVEPQTVKRRLRALMTEAG